MERKKILIPGGKTSDLLLVKAAKDLGFYVITSGRDVTAPAHQFADQFIPADYSDKEAMLQLAKDNHVDYICTSANDIALITTSYVCEKLGLPGHDSYETTVALHHKDKFKALAKKLSLYVPQGEYFSDIDAAYEYARSLPYKAIVKPIDLVGGNGVSAVETDEEKRAAIELAFNKSLNKRIVIEQYIDGTAHSFSTFIVGGKVAFCYSDNEYESRKKYKINTSSGPADHIDSVKDILIEDTEKVAQELKLVDGRVHVQYLMQDGRPYILEITRRSSGDMYSLPASMALGIDTPSWIVKAECGFDCSDVPHPVQQGYYGRHCITARENGITNGIHIDPELDRFVVSKWLWGAYGYQVDDYLSDCLGLLFFKFDTKSQADDTVKHIEDLVTVELIK